MMLWWTRWMQAGRLLALVAMLGAGSAWAQQAAPESEAEPGTAPVAEPTPAPVAQPADSAPELTVAYFGRSFGVSGGLVMTAEKELMLGALAKRDLPHRVLASGPTALQRDGRYLIGYQGEAGDEALRKALAQLGKAEREVLDERLPVLVSPYAVVIQWPRVDTPDLLQMVVDAGLANQTHPDLHREHWQLVRYRLAGGVEFLAAEPPDAPAELPAGGVTDWESKWEIRIAVGPEEAPQTTGYVIGRFLGGGPKTSALLQRLRDQLDEQPFVVLAAGDDLEGPIGWDETLGRGRPVTLEWLSELSPAALVPAASELAFGAEALVEAAQQHGLRYVSANLRWRSGERKGQRVFPAYRLLEFDGLAMAVVGLTPPSAAASLPGPVLAEIEIAPLVDELVAATGEVREELGRRPDLMVALTVAPAEDVQPLLEGRRDSGIDLDVLLADFTAPDVFSPAVSATFPAGAHERRRFRPPFLVARSAGHKVGLLRARFAPPNEPQALLEVSHHGLPVTEDLARDEELRSRMKQTLMKALYEQGQPVLPPAGELADTSPEVASALGLSDHQRGEPARYSEDAFNALAAALLRRRFAVEAVVLHRQTQRARVIGVVREHTLRSWLDPTEELMVTTLTGSQVKKLVTSHRVALAGVSADGTKINGRSVAPSERYRLLTTSWLAGHPSVASVLPDDETSARFRRDGEEFVPDADGETIRLADLVVEELVALAERTDGDPALLGGEIAGLLEEASSRVDSLWTIEARGISVFANGNQVIKPDPDPFTRVQESRVTAPDSISFGARGGFTAAFDSSAVGWENKLDALFNETRIDSFVADGNPIRIEQEAGDDLVLGNDLRFKRVAIPLPLFREGPTLFFASALDTEFTPASSTSTTAVWLSSAFAGAPTLGTPDDDGLITLLRQLDLNADLGLLTKPGKYLRDLRVGATVRKPFSAVLTQEEMEAGKTGLAPRIGLFTQATYQRTLGEARLGAELGLKYYFNSQDDTEGDLGLMGTGRVTLSAPIYQGLSLTLYTEAFVFTGKVGEPAEHVGLGLQWGAALSYSSSFKPGYGIRY